MILGGVPHWNMLIAAEGDPTWYLLTSWWREVLCPGPGVGGGGEARGEGAGGNMRNPVQLPLHPEDQVFITQQTGRYGVTALPTPVFRQAGTWPGKVWRAVTEHMFRKGCINCQHQERSHQGHHQNALTYRTL